MLTQFLCNTVASSEFIDTMLALLHLRTHILFPSKSPVLVSGNINT